MDLNNKNITIETLADNQKAFTIIYDLLSVGQFPGSVSRELAAVRSFVEAILRDNKAILEKVQKEEEVNNDNS